MDVSVGHALWQLPLSPIITCHYCCIIRLTSDKEKCIILVVTLESTSASTQTLKAFFVNCPEHQGVTYAPPPPNPTTVNYCSPHQTNQKWVHFETITLMYSDQRLVALFCDTLPYASVASSLEPHTLTRLYGLTWLHVITFPFPFFSLYEYIQIKINK